MPNLKENDLDLLEIENINKYIDYESCERISQKYVIAKFHKEIEKSKLADYGKHHCITVLDNVKGEFNVPRTIRSVNVLGGREVFIVGLDFFNPYPSVGGLRHTKVSFFQSMEECLNKLKEMDYDIFALQAPNHGGTSLYSQTFNKKSAFIAGHEQFGLSFNPSDYIFVKSLHIPQYGKVESLNVSVAVSIVLSEYVRQINS